MSATRRRRSSAQTRAKATVPPVHRTRSPASSDARSCLLVRLLASANCTRRRRGRIGVALRRHVAATGAGARHRSRHSRADGRGRGGVRRCAARAVSPGSGATVRRPARPRSRWATGPISSRSTVDDLVEQLDARDPRRGSAGSTGRQIRLARLLGRATPPVFLHHPLVDGGDGEKLSKSNQDTGIGELRSARCHAAEVIGRAAAAVGLIDRPRAIPASDGRIV